MTDADLIRLVGEALWGDRWQSAMAHALGLGDPSTVRKWSRGAQSPRPGVWADLAVLLRNRAGAVDVAADLVRQRRTGAPADEGRA